MEKYQRVRKENEKLPDNEIRVKRNARIGRYLRRANDLLTGKIAGQDSVVIKGVSNAMESAVKLAELIKHRVAKIHQLNAITNITISDEYEPLEEGLDHLKFDRQATMLTITLSKSPLDVKDLGYQDPIPESEVQAFNEREDREHDDGDRPRRGGRGRGRGGFRAGFRGGRGGRGGRYEGDRERRPRTYSQERRPRGEGRNDDGYRPPRRQYDREDGETRQRSAPRYDDEERPRRGGYRGGERREGGYRGGERREGGYRGGERREGGYRGGRGSYGENRPEGGYRGGERREGGYRGGRGGYGEDRPEGGYRGGERREGGFRGGRGRGNFEERREGGYRGGERREGGYRGGRGSYGENRPEGGFRGGERREGGYRGGRGRGNFEQRD